MKILGEKSLSSKVIVGLKVLFTIISIVDLLVIETIVKVIIELIGMENVEKSVASLILFIMIITTGIIALFITDAERIQHLNFQFAVQQTADAFPDKGNGAPHRICRRDGRGQEHLAEHPARHKADHLLLIFLIDFPAVVGGDQHL